MDDFWEVLNIEGDLDEAEILFSKIENYCLGSFIEGDLTKIYLSIEKRFTPIIIGFPREFSIIDLFFLVSCIFKISEIL